MLKVYALFAQICYGEIMKKLFVITCLFFLVACNMKGYNSTTNKFSDEEASKNFLKKLHNSMTSADEFLNTDTETHTTSYSSGGKTITCTTAIERYGLDASTFGIYNQKIRKIESKCDDGFSSTTTYD